jgi:formyl-CoA transferase
VFEDPQVKHLAMALPMTTPKRGLTHIVGTAINMQGIESSVRRIPPRLGEHSAEILQQAGYGAAEIDQLRALGVISEG